MICENKTWTIIFSYRKAKYLLYLVNQIRMQIKHNIIKLQNSTRKIHLVYQRCLNRKEEYHIIWYTENERSFTKRKGFSVSMPSSYNIDNGSNMYGLRKWKFSLKAIWLQLIFKQILPTSTIRNIYRAGRRICMLI